jgi:hypothetical protein
MTANRICTDFALFGSANCGTEDIHCAVKQRLPNDIKCICLSSPVLPWNIHARNALSGSLKINRDGMYNF